MKPELYDYDLYPKVVLAGKENLITIKPLGWHAGIAAGQRCTLTITAAEQGNTAYYPEWAYQETIELTADADNCLRFPWTFPTEQEYILAFTCLSVRDGSEKTVRLSLYALDGDMKGRYPFRGDLHVHTARSDGKEAPEIVCANYRAFGYDFMIISDHRRYYPSLEAIRAFRDTAPSFCILPGEEVHLPLTDVHILNVGGNFSVNALVDGNKNQEERGDDPSVRSLDGKCPPVLSREEYEKQIREIAKAKWFDAETADLSYAVCLWAFDRIREAGGLSVFCHPYWRRPWGYQVPEKLIALLLEQHRFDAFEVLGGERYYEQNGFQTARYCDERARGVSFPIVGSTDTHGSTEHNPGGFICSTIIFAKENKKDSLNAAVKESFSVAVDTISTEFRLVGSLRLQKYACFLMNWYFPLHDRLCAIEGEYMRQYAVGEKNAKVRLDMIADDIPAMMRKYFALG